MSTPVARPPVRKRGRETLRDMLLSIAVIMGIVGVVVVFQQRGGRGITVIDPAPAYAGARNAAAYPVRTPRLPSAWRATSARSERSEGGRVTLRVGWITPLGQYAQLVESDRPRAGLLDGELSPGGGPADRVLGTVAVAGTQWQRLRAAQKGDRAIALTQGKITYLVSGTAGLPELVTLAGALR